MNTLYEKKIQKLQEKINKYDTILANRELLEKEANKDYKKIKRKMVIATTALVGGFTAGPKLLGFGFPIVKDQVKKYQDIKTTIDQDGNVTEEKIGYIYKEDMEPNTLYNYSDWTSTLSEESIRYVEKYDLEDINIDEMLTILKQGNFDFNSIGTELEISKQTASSEEELMELPKYEAVYNELDMQDFIYEYETNANNIVTTITSLLGFTYFDVTIIGICALSLNNHKKYFESKICEKKEKCKDKKEQYVRKLQKLNQNIKNEK